MKVKGKYSIEYANGFKQEKYLIEDEDFQLVVKPIDISIGHLNIFKHTEYAAKELKGMVKGLFGDEFFTVSSPLGLAMKSGILELPATQGGNTKVKIKKLK